MKEDSVEISIERILVLARSDKHMQALPIMIDQKMIQKIMLTKVMTKIKAMKNIQQPLQSDHLVNGFD